MRKALAILVWLVLVTPYAVHAEGTESEAPTENPTTCVDRSDPGDAAWAALTAPEGWAFRPSEIEQAGCSGVVRCNTVLDCPCPDSRCACVQSPSCGKLCLCYTECFQGGDPP